MAAGASELVTVLSEELVAIAERGDFARRTLGRLYKQLRQAEGALDEVQGTRTKLAESLRASDEVADRNLDAVRRVGRKLLRVEEEREAVVARVGGQVRRLWQSYRTLRRRLTRGGAPR